MSSTKKDFRYVSASDIVAGKKPGNFTELAKNHLAVCFNGFFSHDEAATVVKQFYGGRADWTAGFEGEQFSLGEAWYHYGEEGIEFDVYAEKAPISRALLEKHVPGLEKKVIDFLSRIGAPMHVRVRPQWAGPGLIVFPAHNHVAENGGVIHYDLDAFSNDELQDDIEVYSFVCMLQQPESGGQLQVWDKLYDLSLSREENFDPDVTGVDTGIVDYRVGDLWMFNGMNAHQIKPFQGDTDRVTLTFHIYRAGGEWHVWF